MSKPLAATSVVNKAVILLFLNWSSAAFRTNLFWSEAKLPTATPLKSNFSSIAPNSLS